MMHTTVLSPHTLLGGAARAADDAADAAVENVMGTGFGDSFWVILALTAVLILLGLDLVRRLRRAKYRDQISAELAAEVAERDARAAADEADPGVK